jgi:hypothetical protein
MIIIASSGSTARTSRYIHHKDTVYATRSLVLESGDCCFCTCDSIIPQFAYLDDENDTLKNDWFSWIIKIPLNCTVEGTLTNLDSETDYLITNQTYGDFYDVDELKDNVWAFRVRWHKVADLLGFGNYKFNITVKDVSNNIIFDKDYPKFDLKPYSCDSAHNTIRIETLNTGYIEGGFDYRGITTTTTGGFGATSVKGWAQQVRWYGRIEVTGHPTQIDNLTDNYRNLLQVQTQIQNEYNLRLEFITTNISNQIIFDYLLSDYILISDYNANNVDEYKNIKVSLLNVESPQPFKNKTVLYNLKFVDYKQNNLKRFY